jgi:osmotically-inducible protein OsmY
MTTGTLTDHDLEVRDAVLQQLAWDSQLDASGIGVTAAHGAITLTGVVDSYAGKLEAERAAKRVRGVRAVANDLQVRLRLERPDADIAADAVRAFELRGHLPESVQAAVHQGHVTLTGSVATLFQRAVAENAIRHVKGVKAIVNRITVTPAVVSRDIRREIVSALHRDAALDADTIKVTVDGDTVTLTGRVRSWAEQQSAEHAAMHAPGIRHVHNHLLVVWPPRDKDVEAEIC